MKKPYFSENQIYHIYNRGVEKRDIFLDDKDYLRFIYDLYEFNNEDSVFNVTYYFNSKSKELESKHLENKRRPRKLLVEILVFALMPNHFHLLLKQTREGGIVKFMQKLGTGYTNYFNKKYERVGGLFQGRFKAVLVKKDAHLTYLPHYIHLNPLDLKFPEWKNKKIKNYKEAIKFLEGYRWSSFLDYIGEKNFPSLTSRKFLLEFWGGEKKYREKIKKWLWARDENLEKIKKITLE